MPEPIRLPLSPFQQTFFASITQAEEQAVTPLREKRNAAVTALLSAEHDPASLATWSIRVDADAIVCTPPLGDVMTP